MAALADKGLDVWALDFYGYGESDRYPEMNDAPMAHPPLGRAAQAADQVDSAVAFLKRRTGVDRILLIGDSGGSLVAGLFATRRPSLISRLVLFAPVTPFTEGAPASATLPAYIDLTPKDLWGQFAEWSARAGPPEVLDSTMYAGWAAAFLDSDSSSRRRSPASVRLPNGIAADLAATAAGRFPYDPGEIRAPTLVVMGEADAIATFPGAQWLLAGLRNAPHRRLVVLGHSSHTAQFEAERFQLYDVLAGFLTEQDH
jgi:pimeloyl-ACP methyl ester carboxylesterase